MFAFQFLPTRFFFSHRVVCAFSPIRAPLFSSYPGWAAQLKQFYYCMREKWRSKFSRGNVKLRSRACGWEIFFGLMWKWRKRKRDWKYHPRIPNRCLGLFFRDYLNLIRQGSQLLFSVDVWFAKVKRQMRSLFRVCRVLIQLRVLPSRFLLLLLWKLMTGIEHVRTQFSEKGRKIVGKWRSYFLCCVRSISYQWKRVENFWLDEGPAYSRSTEVNDGKSWLYHE